LDHSRPLRRDFGRQSDQGLIFKTLSIVLGSLMRRS